MEQKQNSQINNDQNNNTEKDRAILVSTWVGSIVLLIVAATVFLSFMTNVRNNPDYSRGIYLAPTRGGMSGQMMHNPAPAYTQNGISVLNPLPNATVASPLSVLGFGLPAFEAVPGSLQILDANGKVLAQKQLSVTDLGSNQPNGFLASVDFTAKAGAKITLKIRSDNPSGLPANERTIEVPLVVGK